MTRKQVSDRYVLDERIMMNEGKSREPSCASEAAKPPVADPGVESAIEEGLGWLCHAQDFSTSADCGIASHFYLGHGWTTSYPETTGYIAPTLLRQARAAGADGRRKRVRRMLDWLVSIQYESGAFQGGRIGTVPVVPVTFNTGQILIGLAAGVEEWRSRYLQPMRRAADWLVATQDPDGGWSTYPSTLTAQGAKTYEIQTAWGLLEAARIDPGRPYGEAALANIDWALGLQNENGWFEACDLREFERPLTHTTGYALRGVLEGYRFCQEAKYLRAAQGTADALIEIMDDEGFIPGRLDRWWRAAVDSACLTGTAQIACCWFMLYDFTGDLRYRDAAYLATRYVRRTMKLDGSPGVRGGIAGSWPIDGDYMPNSMLSWACKFVVDANLMEAETRAEEARAGT